MQSTVIVRLLEQMHCIILHTIYNVFNCFVKGFKRSANFKEKPICLRPYFFNGVRSLFADLHDLS